MKWGSDHQWVWRALFGIVICLPSTIFLAAVYLMADHRTSAFSPSEVEAVQHFAPRMIVMVWVMLIGGDVLIWLAGKSRLAK